MWRERPSSDAKPGSIQHRRPAELDEPLAPFVPLGGGEDAQGAEVVGKLTAQADLGPEEEPFVLCADRSRRLPELRRER